MDNKLIPILDLSLSEHLLVPKLRNDLKNIGFLYIKNHGISKNIINGVIKHTKNFFNKLSNLDKKKISAKKKKSARGYFCIGDENLNNSTNKNYIDQKEGFDIGNIIFGPTFLENKIFGTKTPWPSEKILPDFQKDMNHYHNELINLSIKILSLIALSLNLPKNYFEDKFKKPVTTLRLLHYYKNESQSDNHQGAGEHTDYGAITILLPESDGLEILDRKKKKWIKIPIVNDLLIMNIGDMMMKWSNYQYMSTIHRVKISDKERYSIPFFFNPNLNTIIKPIFVKNNKIEFDAVDCKYVLEKFYINSGLLNNN